MNCGDCKFWREFQPDEMAFDDAGSCHRRAPAPVGATHVVILGTIRERGVTLSPEHVERHEPVATAGDIWDRQALWPTTLRADFCGEFVSRHERRAFV
ncbi:MAG: hypothetical protein JHD15_19430 [Phenylobacterium sp.]|uniref:hypothetical protein n=1 Tax=Phenylobacterium sp. TaxID=1871053 RepID=UPI001A17F3B0|nr:hypothetical protein [Phenylobacterium sp.]MBJ7412511.1 hypothetical protein [Phenylobacterium sp.]